MSLIGIKREWKSLFSAGHVRVGKMRNKNRETSEKKGRGGRTAGYDGE